MVVYGGVSSGVSSAVLAGWIHSKSGYNHDAMVGHAYLWDPLFFLWGCALVGSLALTRKWSAFARGTTGASWWRLGLVLGSAAWVWCLGLVLGSAAWVFLVVSNGRRQPMTESRHRDILDKTQRSKTAQRVRSRYQTKNRCGCAARRRLTKWSNAMATILWIIAVILVIAGIVALFRRQILWGIVLIVVGLLVGPGGVSLFT
jgi:hypothetical protein